MAPPITHLFDLTQQVLDELVERWPGDAEPLPARQYVTFGAAAGVAWDSEQLTVSLGLTAGHVGDIGVETWQASGAGLWWMRVAAIDVSIIRKHPNLEASTGTKFIMPKPEQMTAAASKVMRDAQAINNALVDMKEEVDWMQYRSIAMESWTPLGPTGDLGGGVLRFRLDTI